MKRKNVSYKFKKIFLSLAIGFFIISLPILYVFGKGYFVWKENESVSRANLNKLNLKIQSSTISTKLEPVKIYDREGILIGEFLPKNFTFISPKNIHNYKILIRAILSAEDKRFFEHSGFDLLAIVRASMYNVFSLQISQGGSTITQQLAKIILNLREKNLVNKIAVTFFAIYIELHFHKEAILSMYLNNIFLGEGCIGFEEASLRYFHKRANELSFAEAALLVGIVPAPSIYNPIKNLQISLHKQETVLKKMVENIQLCKREICDTKPMNVNKEVSEFRATYNIKQIQSPNKKYWVSDIGKFFKSKEYKINQTPDFNDSIQNQLSDTFQSEEIATLGLSVFTTLDYEKQKISEKYMRKSLEEIQKNLQSKIQKRKIDPNILNGLSGTMVSMNPQNGEIETYIEKNIRTGQIGMGKIEEILRQPGSAIKGLIYAIAIEKKIITPSTILIDEKINISGYSPKNWYKGYQGKIIVRKAFAQSVNTISVILLQKIGVDNFLKKLSQILSKPESEIRERFSPNLTLALGSGELTSMELAIIYSTIANGGKKITPKKIIKILDKDSNNLYRPKISETFEQVLDPIACAITINLMEAVVTDGGTMNVGKQLTFPVAGKTGTVQIPPEIKKRWGGIGGVRDSWFAGITPWDVSIVWIGNDFGAPVPSFKHSLSGTVWLQSVLRLIKKNTSNKELIPLFEGNFVRVDICADNEKIDSPNVPCKKVLKEQFYYSGTEPKIEFYNPNQEKILDSKIDSLENEENLEEDITTEIPLEE
ncbi:MAG: transglycosylase domain-containing protein [Leptospiraceae bacterium]|nr:transglycosylase domain-containing protein [Leptospiraceae bacterium]MCK6380455.1 transglycosylase domain-containing protein [Leptospiraceae bacterium]NUM41507.1 transglycosylase domain-containing protein [Leptospiraceae bacterium]